MFGFLRGINTLAIGILWCIPDNELDRIYNDNECEKYHVNPADSHISWEL